MISAEMVDFQELFLSFQIKMKQLDEYIFIELPIEKIDEIIISCGLQIQLSNFKKISFLVKSKIIQNNHNRVIYFKCNLFTDNEEEENEEEDENYEEVNQIYTFEEFEIAIKRLLEILPTLTFSKIQGRFLSNIEDIDKIGYYNSLKYANNFHKVWSSILIFPNIKLTYSECSVCSSETETKTPCNHSLCYACWEQIGIIIDEDEQYQICPMCRNIINKFN